MFTKSQIGNGILVIMIAFDLHTHWKNRLKYKNLLEENEELKDNFHHAAFAFNYLADKLYENKIKMTEFDLIAINNPI